MKKVIPFKQEIIFQDNLAEITSISLEHQLEIKEHLLTGGFDINGSYKMTLSSTVTEDFSYHLPFEIALDERYILDDATMDIEDFYYEIVNDRVLSIHIEVAIDHLEEKEEEEIVMNVEEIEETEEEKELIREDISDEHSKEEQRCIEEENPLPNVFNSISEVETYKSYTVYIVRENDTLEGILTKYGVTKEEVEAYNSLDELKIGDKLIIPNV